MSTENKNNGSPTEVSVGRDKYDNITITAPSKASKSWVTLGRVMDIAENENWTAPYSPPTESLPKRQRVKTVYRLTKPGIFMTKIVEEVIND